MTGGGMAIGAEEALWTLERLFGLADPKWLDESYARNGSGPIDPRDVKAGKEGFFIARFARRCGLPLLPAGLQPCAAENLAWADAGTKLRRAAGALRRGQGLELWCGIEPYMLAAFRDVCLSPVKGRKAAPLVRLSD
ncbi:MAG: hypothetical protein LBW85_13495, partial [Deltaproteobacteria bacterium]|nr:hypothetical protein [Deltaproteobacteria bacterium]